MQRVYVEKVESERFMSANQAEQPVREATDRILERAAPDFAAPIRLVSASLAIGLDGSGVVVAVVEDTEAGFRPLGM